MRASLAAGVAFTSYELSSCYDGERNLEHPTPEPEPWADLNRHLSLGAPDEQCLVDVHESGGARSLLHNFLAIVAG